jgi:transposase
MPDTPPTYRLSDGQYEQIAGFLPANGRRGGQWKDHRATIGGTLWALSDGGRWRNMPEEFGPWQSAYDRFRSWARKGLWGRILPRLQARRQRDGGSDWPLFCIGGTVVRAHQSAAGASEKNPPAGEPGDHALGRSQGGFGTKLHLTCDGQGTPIAAAVGPGPGHETQQAIPLPGEATARPGQPAKAAGGEGCSAGWLREWPREHGIEPVIAHKANGKARRGKFDKKAYKRRNAIERCVGSLKWFRRAAARHEKLATHYPARVNLAIIVRLLG